MTEALGFETGDESFPRNWSRFNLEFQLSRLQWKQFENLTELLIRQLHADSQVVAANLVGTKADGVDFVVLNDAGHISYQVKTEGSIRPSTLRKWVRHFTDGQWHAKSTKFVVILSRRPSPNLQRYYLEYRDAVLREHGFELVLHDVSWIDDQLHAFPSVAGRFFGPSVQLWYEDRVMLARADAESREAKQSPLQRCEVIHDAFFYDDVGVRISAHLPTKHRNTITCLITMAEPGLYDAMITLGNDDLLGIFEESEWPEGLPFHVGPWSGGHFLQIKNVRLRVPQSSAEALGEGLRRLRDLWHERIHALDEARESVGYQRDDDAHGVVIGEIDPRMWRAFLEFANAHLHVEDGPFNIFYDHHAFVQVFTGAHPTMRPGFHVMLETRPFVSLHDPLPREWAQVIWRVPPDMFSDHNTFSRRAWWPVNMTAKWLEEELLPAVWAWHHPDERSALEKLRRVQHEVPELRVRNWWHETRAPLFVERRPTRRDELARLLTQMQQHYMGRRGTHSGSLMQAFDVALLRLLESADLDYWGYVKSKGELHGDSHAEIVASLRSRLSSDYEPFSALELEWRMRTFGEICRFSKGHINQSDVEAVAKALLPIASDADRHNERLAHYRSKATIFPK